MIAASGTPRFMSKSGHTLAGTRAIRSPEPMARSELRNFAQRLDTPSCVVICGVLVKVADELTLPPSTTNNRSSSSLAHWGKSETRTFPYSSGIYPLGKDYSHGIGSRVE